ncbi:hypothetical protein ACFQT0_02690 [Hymenobacter humi]|uniref:Uncharacterized protein n=1 Tax=Hymenobacter humi TaxID=1411620 RepID=A0ABW2TZ13_9BACT
MILDTAALLFAAVEGPRSRQIELTFKAGCLALNRVYRFFDDKAGTESASLLPAEAEAEPGRADFEAAYQDLCGRGLELNQDRDAAWARYRELRTRYAPALMFLSRLTMAPGIKTAV